MIHNTTHWETGELCKSVSTQRNTDQLGVFVAMHRHRIQMRSKVLIQLRCICGIRSFPLF